MNRNEHIDLLQVLLDIVDFRNDRQIEGGVFPIGVLPPGPLYPAFFVPPEVTDGQVTEEDLFHWLREVLTELTGEELQATGFTSLRRLYHDYPGARERAVELLKPPYVEPPPSLDEIIFQLEAITEEKAPRVLAGWSPDCWDDETLEAEFDEEIKYNVRRF